MTEERVTEKLTDEQREFVDRQVESGGFKDPGEYLRDLVRRDQEREAHHEKIRAELIKGEQSGGYQPFDIERFKEEMAAKYADETGRKVSQPTVGKTVTLTERQAKWVKRRAREKGHDDENGYFLELLMLDDLESAHEKVFGATAEDGGRGGDHLPCDFEDLRAAVASQDPGRGGGGEKGKKSKGGGRRRG